MGKIKYPNPKFFRARTNMDWKAQGENVKEIAGIVAGMLKETDWAAVGKKMGENCRAGMQRAAEEFAAVKAMTPEERLDLLKNGEKHLGRLYRAGSMATVRREWRGIRDTGVDFAEWLKMWGMLLGTFSKDLVPALNATLWYRWMISYMCCVGFMDKNTLGQRGRALKMSHLMIYDIFRYVAENLVFLAKCDKKNGNSEELNKKVVLFDEMTMGQIMAGFPDLLGIPYQLMPVFLVSEIDQLTCVPYIDAVESFGLPADTCPVPSSECGALVIDAAPHGRVLHFQLHALRRQHHGLQLYVPPLPGSAGVPPDLPGPVRIRGDRGGRHRGYQGLHPLRGGADRCQVELGRLLRHHEALQRGDRL